MSDEPRRSVRSTKGYHSHKEQEIEGNVDQPKKKGAATKKGANKKASKEPSPELEANEDGDVIRCICGATTQEGDEDGEEWIACEHCGTWQHNVCMGIPTENVSELPDYYCEKCRPEDHRELLSAIKRHEKLWEKRRSLYEAEKKARKNRKGKGGSAKKKKVETKSTVQHTNGQAKESPATSGREGSASAKKETVNKAGTTKRKAREDSQDQDQNKTKQRKISDIQAVPSTPAAPATPENPPVFATPALPNSVASLQNQPKPKHTPAQDLPVTISDLKPAFREGLAQFLLKMIEAGFKTASDNGHFKASPGSSIQQNALRLTIELDGAMYNAHPTREAYTNQSKLVAANLKRNQELFGNLLSRELSVNQLAVMSEDDMKSSEQRRKEEEELARAERQIIMVKDEGPRIKRTHKGDELVENNFGADGEILTREQRDPNGSMAERSRENSYNELINESPSEVDYPNRPKHPLNINTQAGTHERKASAQFSYQTVVDKLPTPTNAQASRRVSGPVLVAREALEDPDVDRMLEDGPESPPYSPKEDSDPTVVWNGQVSMNAIATFDASAKHIGGADFSAHAESSYVELFGKRLVVTGRIEPDKANEYLCGLRWSPGTDMIVVAMTPRGEVATQEFTKIFEYFREKNRYGVIGNRMGPSQVRDIYLVPIEAGSAEIPIFLSNLEDNKLPDIREERVMLVVVVYRGEELPGNFDGNQSPSLITHPQRQMSQASGPVASPLTQQGSFKSPTDAEVEAQRRDAQRRGEELARGILGPELIRSATVAFILPQAGVMVEKEWTVIKEIFEHDMKARTDLQHLGQLLADRANAPEHHQQQQNNDA